MLDEAGIYKSLFGVGLLFKSIHDPPDDTEPLWELQVILVEAYDEEDAQERAAEIAKKAECSYKAVAGNMVTWKFMQIESICPIDDKKLEDGTELYSTFMKESTVNSLLEPFDD